MRSSSKNREKNQKLYGKNNSIEEINEPLNLSAEYSNIDNLQQVNDESRNKKTISAQNQNENANNNEVNAGVRDFKVEKEAAIIDEDVNSEDAKSVDDKGSNS